MAVEAVVATEVAGGGGIVRLSCDGGIVMVFDGGIVMVVM